MSKLKNAQHEEFCQQWIIDFNGARAAHDAGFGKDKVVARVTASHLLKRADVWKRILELLEIRSRRTQITQDRVLQELAILGFSDFNHYGRVNKDGSLKLRPFSEMKSERTRAIKSITEINGANGRSTKFKLHEKVRPLELIGKHLGMFAEAHSLDVTGSVVFEVISAVPRPRKSNQEKEE